MADLADLWQGFVALAATNPRVVVPLRAWLRGWAQGLDALARSLGAPRPESIAAPQSWRTDVESVVAETAGTQTRDAIRAWEAWYAPVAARLDIPPSTLLGESAATGAGLTWRSLRDVITAPPWAAYATAEASRWNDALASAGELPPLLAERVRGAEGAVRAWWTMRNARSAMQRPPTPPPGTPSRSSGGALLALGAALLAVAVARRRRR